MTDPNRRHITIILDRSGSMITVKDDTEGGLRAFLETQAEAPGTTTVSLHQFDDKYDTVYDNKPLADVPPFTLRPRGATALLDAVGRTITTLGEHLDAKPETERPGEVVVVILTDGHENASTEYTHRQVKDLITQQQDTYGWTFVFLGADQDAFAASASMGIGRATTLSYSGTRTRAAMTNASRMVARGTTSGVHAFSDDERDDSTD